MCLHFPRPPRPKGAQNLTDHPSQIDGNAWLVEQQNSASVGTPKTLAHFASLPSPAVHQQREKDWGTGGGNQRWHRPQGRSSVRTLPEGERATVMPSCDGALRWLATKMRRPLPGAPTHRGIRRIRCGIQVWRRRWPRATTSSGAPTKRWQIWGDRKPATGGGPLVLFLEFTDARDGRSGTAMRLAPCPNVLGLGLGFSLSNFNLILLWSKPNSLLLIAAGLRSKVATSAHRVPTPLTQKGETLGGSWCHCDRLGFTSSWVLTKDWA
jgi:hypothetical protein